MAIFVAAGAENMFVGIRAVLCRVPGFAAVET